MLSHFTIENVKNHCHSTFEPVGPLTALVGVNGAGKSTVLETLHYMHQLGSKSIGDVFSGPRDVSVLVRRGENRLRLFAKGVRGPHEWEAALQFQREAEDRRWECSAEWRLNSDTSGSLDHTSDSFSGAHHAVAASLRHAVYLRLEARAVGAPSYSEDEQPRVEFNGAGVASTFDYYLSYDKHRAEAVLDAVRRIVPLVRDIRVRRARVRLERERVIRIDGRDVALDDTHQVMGQELVFDMVSGDSIPAHACSEGTLLCTGLLTSLHSERLPDLVLLDDLETALHPAAQRTLIKVLKALSDDRPFLQVVVATHSPYVVDHLSAEQVWAIGIDETTGCAMPRRLSEHPQADTALQVLSPGEMWSAFGENWSSSEERGSKDGL